MTQFRQHLAALATDPEHAEALAALGQLMKPAKKSAPATLSDDDLTALAAARKAHRERGDLDLAARLYDVDLALAKDPSRRADLLLEKGKLEADERLDEAAALACFREVLRLRPADAVAKETLEQLELVSANWEKIVAKYLAEAKAATDRQLATSLYVSVAEIHARQRSEPAEVEQYLRRALEVEPKNRRAASHLERLLRQQARWADLGRLLEQRIDAVGTRDERVAALLALADLAVNRLDDTKQAIACMQKVLVLDPAHTRAFEYLVAAFSAEDNWLALVKLYEAALKSRVRAGDPREEMATALQIAMIFHTRLGQPDAAEVYFRRVRTADPAHPAMLDFYRGWLRGRGEGVKLLAVLQAAQRAATDAGERAALAVELANVAENDLGNAEKAIEAWKGIVRQEPDNADARAALHRLYERTEKWNALVDLLKEEIETISLDAPDGRERRVERLRDVCAVYRDRLRLDVMEINTWNKILELAPGHVEALDAIAAKYETLGRWNDHAQALRRKADAPDLLISERAALLRRVAAVYLDRLASAQHAVKPLEDLLLLDPRDTEARGRLKEIHVKRRQWRALLELLGQEVEVAEPDARRALLCEMAQLATEKLADLAAATDLWTRVLDVSPGDTQALSSLATVYEKDKKWPALAEVLLRQRAAIGAADPRAAAGLLERLGSIYLEKMNTPADAAVVYRELVELQPQHTKAMRTLRDLHAQAGDLDALVELFGARGGWDELIDVLHAVADKAGDPDAKRAALDRAVDIIADHPVGADRATRAYERLLQVDAANVDAARALVPLYRKAEKWHKLLSTCEVLVGHAEGASGVDEKRELLAQMQRLAEERLGSKAMAFDFCAQGWALPLPDGAEADVGLAELLRLAQEADGWARVADLVEARAARASGATQLTLTRELARVRAVKLGQADLALAAWRRVLDLAPDDESAMSAIEELAGQAGEWGQVVDMVRRRSELEGDPKRATELLFRVAQLQEQRLEDGAAAALTYGELLARDPQSLRAVRALARAQAAAGDFSGQVDALGRELELVGTVDERVELRLRAAAVCADRLDDTARAFELINGAFEAAPQSAKVHAALERLLGAPGPERIDAARLLCPIYERADQADRLAAGLEILRDGDEDPETRAALDRRLVALYSRRLGDPFAAYTAATRVLHAAPEDEENRRAIAALAGELEAHDELARELGLCATAAADRADAVERVLRTELAELFEERLARPEDAEREWRRVIELDAADVRAWAGLERLLGAAGRWQDLCATLEERALEVVDADKRREILFQLCDLHEGVLEDGAAARATYLRVLDLDPGAMRAYKALERLTEAAGDHAALEELLTREQAWVGESEAQELRCRRAELRATLLGDESGALDLVEEVLAREADRGRARALAESLFERPEHRARVVLLLAPLYEADGAWVDLLRMLRAERELAGGGAEALAVLARMASVEEERLGDEGAAFGTWREALAVEPVDPTAREQLLRLARLLGRWDEAATALEGTLERAAGDTAVVTAVLGELTRIYELEFGDDERAIGAHERLLLAAPDDLEVAAAAGAALERLYELQGAWAKLIELLRTRADASGGDERHAGLERVARLLEERLGDVDGALATWRELLAGDSEHAGALGALERLHLSRGEWRDLVEILARQVAVATVPAAQRDLSARIARLYEQELGEPGDAIAAWLGALDAVAEDGEALGALARLYAAAERWSDLLDIDERRLAAAKDPMVRVALAAGLGQLLRDRLERPEEALERFGEALTGDPTHAVALAAMETWLAHDDLRVRAAAVLEPIYDASGDAEKLCALSELLAQHEGDARELVSRWRSVAVLREFRLADPGGAFVAWGNACRAGVADPDLVAMLAELARVGRANGKEAELLALYREIVADIADGELQQRVQLDTADLARAGGDLEVAREYYQRALDASPDDERALASLESLYRETENFASLREILVRRADRAEGDPAVRRTALVEIAALCEDRLGEKEEACAAWEKVLELEPTDAAAHFSLDRLYAELERFSDLAALLERRAGFAEDLSEAVELRFRVGEIFADRLEDKARAIESFQSALGGDGQHAGSITALERFLDDLDLRLVAAETLEPIYVGRQDWRPLARLYEIRVDAEADGPARFALIWRIARLYEEQLEDFEGAFSWYGQVFRAAPEDIEAREQLSRLAMVLGKWEDLATLYRGWLDGDGAGSTEAVETWRTVADLYDRRLGDVDRARDAWLGLLAITPTEVEAISSLEALLTRAARWSELGATYELAIESALEPERRKELYGKLARVQETRLDAPDRAIETWRAVLDLDQEDDAAIAQLDRLYQLRERWSDLAELLSAALVRAVDPPEANRLRVRLADILEHRQGEVAGAIDLHDQALAIDPGFAPSFIALERLVVQPEHRERIAALLEPVYREQDQWQKLVVILEARLEFVVGATARAELLREVARLHADRGGDLVRAFDATARAWREDVSSEDGYLELERLAERDGAWERLAEAIDACVEGMYDYDLAATLLARLAKVEEERRHRPDAAMDAYRRVLDVKEDDAHALAQLDRLLTGAGDAAALLAVLERRVELVNDPMEKKELLYRIADLHEQALARREAAVATWRQVLTLDDQDAAALDALERIYRAANEWRELAEILARRIELAGDPEERRMLRYVVAAVVEGDLGDLPGAIEQYRAVLDDEPRDAIALESLESLYERQRSWHELIEVLDRRVELEEEPARRAELAYRAARVTAVELSEPEQAIERYRKVLDDAPTHEATRTALGELMRGDSGTEAAADALEPLLRAEGRFAEVGDLLARRLIAAGSDPDRRAELHAQLAEVQEQGLGDLGAAQAAWGQRLTEAPEDERALAEVERLAAARGAFVELAALLEKVLGDTLDGQAQRRHASRLAALCEGPLADMDRAITFHRRALDVGGDGDREILAALDRLLEGAGRFPELAEILVREVAEAATEDEQAALWVRLAELRELALGDVAGALSAYAEALDRTPADFAARAALERMLDDGARAGDHARIVAILEPLYEADADHSKLCDLAEARAKTADRGDRAQLHARVAELAERQLGDEARAFDAVGRWLAEDASSEEAAELLERLARSLGRWADAVACLDAAGAAGGNESAGRALARRRGRILFDELGDPARAEEAYRSALEADPRDGDTLAALERVCRMLGDPARLSSVLAARVEAELDPGVRRELLSELARLREETAGPGDDEAAVAAWRRVLDTDETDQTAHERLIALLERLGRWEELATALEGAARVAPNTDSECALRRRHAETLLDRVGDAGRAAAAWRSVVDLAPDDVSALVALEDVERARGEWAAVEEVLSRRLTLTTGASEKVVILVELARVAEVERGASSDAASYLAQALEEEPENADLCATLERLHTAAERWYELIDMLDKRIERCAQRGDAAGEVELLVRAAGVWEEKLNSGDAAAELCEKALARDPRCVPALGRLARIYEGSGDHARCAETLERALALGPTGREAADLHHRIGCLAEAQGAEPPRAAESWERALEYDRGHVAALRALERLARDAGDHAKLASLLERRVDAETEVPARLACALELADLWRTKLAQPLLALPALEAALRLAPEDAAVVEALADLYFAAGRSADAEPMYRRLADQARAARRPRDVARFGSRLGSILERAGDEQGALAAYEDASKADPTNGGTLAGLGRIYFARKDWETARKAYRAMLLQNLDAHAGVTKADVYLQLGRIHSELGEKAKAKGMYERGLEIEPAHAGLRGAAEQLG